MIPVAIRRWRKAWFSTPIKAERKAFRDAVQAQRYDAIIDAQGLVKSAALVTRLAHGVKHGMDWQTAREPLASLFYNRRHHIAKQQHAVERTRELFAKSLGYTKPETQGDYAISQHFLRDAEKPAQPWLVFLHATTRDDKHWPETHWRRLIELMQPAGIHIKLPWVLNMSASVLNVWQPVFRTSRFYLNSRWRKLLQSWPELKLSFPLIRV